MKKIISCMMAVMMALFFAGCSVSIGTPPRLYDDVFTWGNESSMHSKETYKISLGEYGSMELHLDTSFGHQFELDGKTNTFEIRDKEGDIAVFGTFATEEQYRTITSMYDSLEICRVNNRDLAVVYDDSGKYYAFTYLADCGLDAGLVLESEDDDNFKYLAFEGKALKGSSTDIRFYLGDSDNTEANNILLEDSAASVSRQFCLYDGLAYDGRGKLC